MKRRRGEEEAMAAAGCLRAWAAESEALAAPWRPRRGPWGPWGPRPRGEARGPRGAAAELLRSMRGLPAALATLPLELTVLYNSLVFAMGASECAIHGEAEEIRQGLLRVLEARGAAGQDLGTEELWQKVLQEVPGEELQVPLQRLAALQGAWWLATNRLGSVAGLFRLLSGARDPGKAPCSQGKSQLLSLLRAWKAPAEEASLSLVQSAQDLKEVLCTAAALLQGLQELEAGNLPAALSLLQEAAGGFCSKRLLAQIYTCLSCCAQRMSKPQTALQHLKRALQVDSQCLPALSRAAALFHELGQLEAELQALALLAEALERNPPAAASPPPCCLIQTEQLVRTPALAALVRHQHLSEVKYLLAQRYLESGRVADAVEHYLDFLSLLQDGLQQQVPLDAGSALPRLPEVLLEAVSALQQAGRPRDAISVCEEVVGRTANLIPQTLRVEERPEQPERPAPEPQLPAGRLSQKKESLCCLVWRTAAYLHQGWAWAKLGEPKEAVTQFSRCLSDLLRVQLYQPGVETAGSLLPEVKLLQKIRLLSLLGRGAQFLELGKLREALLDFQYGLQVSPGDPAAASYLVQALWKLERKQEAAARWQKLSESPTEEAGQQEGLGRPCPLYLAWCLEQAAFPQRESLARDLQDYLESTASSPSTR